MTKLFGYLKNSILTNNELMKPQLPLVGLSCLIFHTLILYTSMSFSYSNLYRNLVYLRSYLDSTNDRFHGFVVLGTFNQSLCLLVLQFIMFSTSLLMITEKYWPKILKRYTDNIWIIGLIILIPFYNAFIFLLSYGQTEWVMSFFSFLFLLILIVDWRMLIFINFTGILLAFICMFLLQKFSILFNAHMNPENYLRGLEYLLDHFTFTFPFILALIVGFIFSKNLSSARENKSLKSQLHTMRIVAASIAHELGTPIASLDAAITLANRSLPEIKNLLSINNRIYNSTRSKKLPIKKFNSLEETLKLASNEVNTMKTIINMLLVRLSPNDHMRDKFCLVRMNNTLIEAIKRYPYRDIKQKKLIYCDLQYDFLFLGNDLLMMHVIFNIIKNALYQIQAHQKGEIYIWTEKSDKSNYLHIKDTGPGIPKDILPYIYKQFYSNTIGGTGIGLSFCAMIMELFGGKISCKSELRQFTQFSLSFPFVTSSEIGVE